MWSSRPDRRLFLAGLLALPACGFTPVYGPTGRAQGLFGNVLWQAPTNASEFDLTEQLRHRLGIPKSPEWRLNYAYETSVLRMGGADANRARLFGTLSYQLLPADSVASSLAGEIKAFAGFTIGETTPDDTALIVSNRVARRDAEKRLATRIADLLVSDLMIKLGAPA